MSAARYSGNAPRNASRQQPDREIGIDDIFWLVELHRRSADEVWNVTLSEQNLPRRTPHRPLASARS